MSLEHFFDPHSVAIVGASRTKGKVGYEILSAALGSDYSGSIFAVNPNADIIQGVKSYKSLEVLPEKPDLVVIVVSSKHVIGNIRQCINIGCKAAIVVSSGFKEIGDEGARLEKELVRLVRSSDMRLIGPNCIGMMLPGKQLNASFAGVLPVKGPISYFSQSGSIMAAIVDMANTVGLGFSKLISIGNKADVNELDVLEALGRDEDTKVIAGYLETISNGDAFIRMAEMISKEKPVLLMKSGVTEFGAKAAFSHTGRLVGSESAYECIFERAGVIRCESIKVQFDFARAFATQPLPKSDRIAIIANAGGAGIMAADAIDREGLTLAKLTAKTTRILSENLSDAANIDNPIDLLGDALSDRYEMVLKDVVEDENVDIVLVMLSPHAMTECIATAEAVVKVSKENGHKPILACFLGASKISESLKVLWEGGVPYYDSPESAVATAKAMAGYSKWCSRPKRVVKMFSVNRRKVDGIISRCLKQKQYEIGEMRSKEILEAYGFTIPKGAVATSAEQAVNIANQIGYPVVLKIWSPGIVHKMKVGGVKINIVGDQAVRDGFDLMMYRIPQRLPEAKISGIVVEQMCRGGQEVILGMHRDRRFGPLMMFGMGGKLVEVLEDVAFYPAPLTADEAKEMLVRTQTYRMLTGEADGDMVSLDLIAEALQRLSQLAMEFPQMKEIDINPFVVGRESVTPLAVDAMITLEDI